MNKMTEFSHGPIHRWEEPAKGLRSAADPHPQCKAVISSTGIKTEKAGHGVMTCPEERRMMFSMVAILA